MNDVDVMVFWIDGQYHEIYSNITNYEYFGDLKK